jgi:hypothetical protein
MPLSFPSRTGSRHRRPRTEDLPSDATLFLPQGLPCLARGLPPARRPGPVASHSATPPKPAPQGKGGQPLLYWRPVAAAGVLTVALVILGAAALKPANPPASPKANGPAPPEAQPSAVARQLHGTSVAFVSTPTEAARLAGREGKLLFLLHVSGHFEDPDFT